MSKSSVSFMYLILLFLMKDLFKDRCNHVMSV